MNNMILFWSVNGSYGYFSNWFRCNITDKNGIKYTSTEQYFMYQKAILFNDLEVAEKILKESNQAKIKALGREVKNFVSSVWDDNKYRIMVDANRYKFSQSPDLKDLLLATRDSELVEASPYDKIWGIGLSPSDIKALDKISWRGQNLLGKALMEVRSELK